MIHAHIALWIVGSPRFDKINVPKEKSSGVVMVEPETADVGIHSSEEVAKRMASFWDRVVTEWNVAKAYEIHKGTAVLCVTGPRRCMNVLSGPWRRA